MNGKRIKSLKTAASSQGIIDRFSDLPDDIASHILCLLTIGDLTGVGFVSKRYRKLPLSSLLFSLNVHEFSDAIVSIYTSDQWKGLLDSLDKFLICRGCKYFRFSWCDHDRDQDQPQCSPEDLKFLMIRWINNVVRCNNIEKIRLKIDLPPSQAPQVAFPASVFGRESLRYLSLKGMFTTIETPSSASFSNLESLKLREVKITDEGFFKWISHSCRCMKELMLKNVYGFRKATLESSSLKWCTITLNEHVTISSLNVTCEKLEYIYLGMPCNTSNHGALTIYAPNLKKLKWNGDIMKCQNMGEFTRLEKAEIELDHGVSDFYNVFNLFWSVRRVKVLVLTEMAMKCLFNGGLTPAQLLLLLNVRYLRIRRLRLMDDEVPAMVSLLNSIPNLGSLYIEAGPNSSKCNSSSFHMRYWKLENLAFIHQLKKVTIELSDGSNGVIFTHYILDHAINLQKMVIHHLPEQSYKVRSYKWLVTSKAKVVFRVREDEQKRIISIGNIYNN